MRQVLALSAMVCSLRFSSVALADDQATTELRTLLSHISQYKAMFKQTITDTEGNVVHEANGNIVLARPDKLRWETVSPDENTLVADGETVWNIDPFVEQVTIIDQKKAVKDNPIMLITATDDETWSKFVVRKADAVSDEYFVTPVNQEGQIRELTLIFSDDALVGLTTLDAQEQISSLKFSAVETQFPLAADAFTPSFSDSYIVDDQR